MNSIELLPFTSPRTLLRAPWPGFQGSVRLLLLLALSAAPRGLTLAADGVAGVQAPDPLSRWTQLTTSANLQTVGYLGGRYFAGGDMGTLLSSEDGMNWTFLDTSGISDVSGLAYGDGVWVAVGPRGQIIASSDGVSWTPRWSGVAAHFRSVTFGKGQFVAVGGESTPSRAIVTSDDGIRWTVRELSPGQPVLWDVHFHDDRFIASGNRGSLLASPDGAAWQRITNSTLDRISGLAFGNGQFVALGSGAVFRSEDGITWTNRLLPDRNWFDVAFGADRFVAAGDDNLIWTSTNGWDWAVVDTAAPWPLSSVAFGDGQFVAVGQSGLISTSPDGLRWTNQTSGSIHLPRQVAIGHGQMVVVGDSGVRVGPRAFANTSPLAVSSDGQSWSYPFLPSTYGFFSVNLAGGRLFACGHVNANPVQRVTATSGDGLTWSVEPLAQDAAPMKILHAQGRYVGVGNALYASSDGLDWTESHTRQSGSFTGLAYGNGLFVALDPNGQVFTSDSGTNWTQQPYTTAGVTEVAFGNGVFVAVGYHGSRGTNTVVVSTDAVHWSAGSLPAHLVTPGNPPVLASVAFGGGWFVAVGSHGTVLTSHDGQSWTPRYSGVQSHLSSVAFADGKFVAVGNGGTVLESGNVWAATLTVLSTDSAGIQLALTGVAGQIYRLQAAADLAASTWLDLALLTNSAPATLFLDAAAPATHRFYRALPERAPVE